MAERACRNRLPRLSMAEVMERVDDVKRDDELIRSVMFELEDAPEWVVFVLPDWDDEDAEEVRKYYHLRLLADEGYLEETGAHGGNFRITGAGHDFLRMMREEGLWHQIKAKASEVPGYSLRLMFEIGHAMLKQKLKELGLPLP
ncbi:DUF2513 domain-containing protein [Gemmobacter lutimaris]|nr:DUF2513 domain-containing protein [Gemmobacter lutimaris]